MVGQHVQSHNVSKLQVDGDLISMVRVVVYNDVATTTFLLWDTCICFRHEVELIWMPDFSKRPMTPIKFLYLLFRYFGLGYKIAELLFIADAMPNFVPSAAACRHWVLIEEMMGIILALAMEVLFIMRTLAFFGNSRRLSWIIIPLAVCGWIGAAAIAGISIPKMKIIAIDLPPALSPCLLTGNSRLFSAFWIPALLIQTLLFLMVMIQFFRTSGSHGPLYQKFIHDGTWSFALYFGFLLACVITWELFPNAGVIVLTWTATFMSYCGAHLILNLRNFAKRDNAAVATLSEDIQLDDWSTPTPTPQITENPAEEVPSP